MFQSRIPAAFHHALGAALLSIACWQACITSVASAAVYTVGSDVDCDHLTIPDALVVAAGTAADDELRLAEDQWNLSLTLANWDPDGFQGGLTITGGYTSCTEARAGARGTASRTLLDGTSSGPVVSVTNTTPGPSVVTLRNLLIKGATSDRGLAVLNADVTLENTRIEDNVGGILVDRGSLTADETTEVFLNDAGTDDGGGLLCLRGSAQFAGTLQQNEASLGGGVYVAATCELTLAGGSQLIGNVATYGGGAYVAAGTLIGLPEPDEFGPQFIQNEATQRGGGLYLTSQGEADLFNSWIVSNFADISGGGVEIDNGRFTMQRLAAGCLVDTPGSPCSLLSQNRLFSLSSTITGSAVNISDNGTVTIKQTNVRGNKGPEGSISPTVIEGNGLFSTIRLESVAFVENQTSIVLRIRQGFLFADFISMSLNEPASLLSDTAVASSALDLGEVWMTSSVLENVNGFLGTTDIDCVIADDLQGVGVTATRSQELAGPHFVQPSLNDMRLLPTSPAVDYCGNLDVEPTTTDAAGNPRPVDALDVADLHGTYDLGAFERVGIFSDGFESGTTAAW